MLCSDPRRNESINGRGVNDDLQTLFTKFLQNAFTQKVGIAFAGSRKFDNSLGDHFVGEIASLGKPKSYASHFESDPRDPLSLGIESGIVQKLSDGHDQPVSNWPHVD
jgi:hypothetical protein